MKIALVSPYSWAVPGGVNAHIAALARELQARGHDARVIAPGRVSGSVEMQPITIGRTIPVPSGGSLARVTLEPWLGPRVGRLLKREQFDIVHLHEPLISSLTLEVLRHSRAVNIGTFHAAHEGGSVLYALLRPLLTPWFRRLHGRIAVSPAAARLVARYFPGPYEIIPNGIDIERFATPAPCPPELAAARPYVLFVGRIEARKGLPHLLRAHALLKRTHPDLNLVVVGGGRKLAHYRAMSGALGLTDVHFTGYVPDAALPAYYQHAAVFCAPNTGNESFGIVLLEAMAAGCPVVATAIEGFSYVVTHGRHALLTPPGDPFALAAAIGRCLTEPALAQSLAEHGRMQASEFAWPRMTERILALYQGLLARRSLLVPPIAPVDGPP